MDLFSPQEVNQQTVNLRIVVELAVLGVWSLNVCFAVRLGPVIDQVL